MEIKLLVSDIHVHLHVKPDHEVLARLDAVIHRLGLMENRIMKELDDLKAQVAAGVPITQAQLDALGSNLTTLTSAVATFDINNTEPAVVPVVIPPAAAARKR